MQTFDNGLLMSARIMVDAIVGGSLNNKTPDQFQELFEVLVSNNYQRLSERNQKKRVLEVDITTILLEQIQALSIQNVAIQKHLGMLTNTSPAPFMHCDFY